MKKLPILLWTAGLLLAGCASKELGREEALRLLLQDKQYPRVIDYDIYRSDPQFARAVLEAELEKEGWVTVQRTQKLADTGKPLIEFTAKAKPYLLPTPAEDRKMDIQKVKIADEELVEVTGIQTMEGGKQAVAEYTTAYKNTSGFSALTKTDYNQPATHKAYFVLYDDGWRLQKER